MADVRRAGLALFLLFIVSLPAVTPRIYASDEIEYFAFLRSAWFDGDLSFDNEYRHFYESGLAKNPGFHETFLERTTATGRRENFATIGCAVLWAPFYAVGHLVAHAMRASGSAVALDGYSRPYVAAVAYGSAFYGLLALLLGWHALRLIAPPEGQAGRLALPEILAVLAVWFGTPLLFYMYIAPPMSHATSAFAVAAFITAWLHVRRTWSPWGCALLGALAALMGMVREQDVFFAAGPALDFLWTMVVRQKGRPGTAPEHLRPRKTLLSVASGLASFALVISPQLLAYLAINGRLGPSPLVARKMTWSAPHALEVLASPEHGLLAWTPLAALGFLGLASLAGRSKPAARRGPARVRPSAQVGVADPRRVGLLLLLMAALQVYVAGCVESWTVAGAFGQRRFVGLTALLVIGLGILVARTRRRTRRRLLLPVVIAATWWNLGLMVQFGAGLMDRQRLELARNAYNTFVVVPRLVPRLAYQYLFDRQAFYRPAPEGTASR